jgi:DNA topoisomerase-1
MQKNDKVLHNWTEEGILVERVGTFRYYKGKLKLNLVKSWCDKINIGEVQEMMIAKKTPAKKKAAKSAS